MPVGLHAVAELHPELGLLLRGETFPSLLDASESRVRDGMVGGSADVQGVERGNWAGADGGRGSARHSASGGAKKHGHCAAGRRWQDHVEKGSIDSTMDMAGPGESGSAEDSTGEESGGGEGDGRGRLKLLV